MKHTWPYTSAANLARDFVSRGVVALDPDTLGIEPALHMRIYEAEKSLFRAKARVSSENIPEVLDVLNAPGVRAAVDTLLGPNWAILPYTHNTPFVSGAYDQHWHKDDNGPYNLRKPRHHQSVQLELLYYPQAVEPDMGPTAIIPYSQYWTFDHEENQDNFAGADHLDFNYQLEGMETVPVSGPRSSYTEADIAAGTTGHDVRMREAPERTGWPLCKQAEVAPLKAGSVVLYSHNLFHRGNHRRDAFPNWKANPRFMWRFWLYRTSEPAAGEPSVFAQQHDIDAPAELERVWNYHFHWLHGLPASRDDTSDLGALESRLQRIGEAEEPARIGAAYALAAHQRQDDAVQILATALHAQRESVRRAATYGLIAMGEYADATFASAIEAERKWVRKAGIFGLGECGHLNRDNVERIEQRLANDKSVYLRSVAAHALGSLARRAVAAERNDLSQLVAGALTTSLQTEQNRLAQNLAQKRSIKFVRPTDESDVCEGIGITYGHDRFKPVRSAVRECALASAVIIATHADKTLGDRRAGFVQALANVVTQDDNVFAVGLALDALSRCGADNVPMLAQQLPMLDAESLSQAQRVRGQP